MLFASLPLLAALHLPAAQTPSAAPGNPPAAIGGMAVYENDALRLKYSYPGSWMDAKSMVEPAFEASVGQDPAAATAAKCLSLPFSRMQTGTGSVGLVLLVRADAGCLKKKFTAKSVDELAQGEAQGLAAAGAKTSFGHIVDFAVAGHPAALLQGSFALPTGQAMQAMVVCVLTEPDVACWQFLSDKPAGLSNMSAFPVSIAGSPAGPLVPAEVLTRP